jgi:outer membrane protein TolC
LALVQHLYDAGDASGSELLRAERGLNEAEAGLVNRRNRFLEDARLELTKAEDEIAQNEQLLIRRLASRPIVFLLRCSRNRQEHPGNDGWRSTWRRRRADGDRTCR